MRSEKCNRIGAASSRQNACVILAPFPSYDGVLAKLSLLLMGASVRGESLDSIGHLASRNYKHHFVVGCVSPAVFRTDGRADAGQNCANDARGLCLRACVACVARVACVIHFPVEKVV